TAQEHAQLSPHLERVPLEAKQVLFEIDQPIDHVYFLETAVASVLSVMADGGSVEAATIGYEGMVGLPVFHGTDRTSAQSVCQVPGGAFRLSADVFRTEAKRMGTLTLMLHRYSQALFTLTAQSSACNRLHAMTERCARWLL